MISQKRFTNALMVATILLGINACKPQSTDPKAPIAKTKAHSTAIHGQELQDPYFWLRLSDEQKNAESPDAHTKEVLDYLNAENDYTAARMAHTKGLQDSLYEEIVARIKEDDESLPWRENGYWYYERYEKGKEYPLHCRKKTLEEDSEEEILLDENKLAEGLDYLSVSDIQISPDNKIMAYSVDSLSRRIYTVRFVNLETGELLPDILQNTESGGAWANDNKTFFYTTKNPVSLRSEKTYRHKLGEAQPQNKLVYHETDSTFYIGVSRSKSGQFINIWNSSTTTSDYQILSANSPEGEFKQFTPRTPGLEYQIFHLQQKFYILTNDKALNFRIMETNEASTAQENWKEVIPHDSNVFIADLQVFADYLVIQERKNALSYLRIIDQKTGDSHYIEFDEPAYTLESGTNLEFETDYLRFGYGSLKTPYITFDYNMKTKERELKKQRAVLGSYSPDDYITERLFAKARDGAEVPISLVYKKGLVKDGKAPLLLYAYGSYGSTTDPYFFMSLPSLLDRGFVYAIAHIRGGQLKGRQWYEDGKLLKKKNTFNDFIDCGRYLVSEKYTSHEHLYAQGGSAGGLLMGAIANMAPEDYRGILAAVPFVDVINTMLDESIPLTTNEFSEWGNPKDKTYFDYMLSYSPYDNVEKKDYANMLVTTGLFDSQVQYWEPAKWVAKLRANKTDENLLLLHTNMGGGHGGASGRFEYYRETALEFAFIIDLERGKK